MKSIITDLSTITIAEPFQFLNEHSIDKEAAAEITTIVDQIKEVLKSDDKLVALSAPQIGVNKKVFCIKFNDIIKTFINPIITKKSGCVIGPEVCASFPGKEILIARPQEITAVYYNDEFKYEDNKFMNEAARLFDQQTQLLDGISPEESGLISDVEKDGSLANLSDEDVNEIIEVYKKFIAIKSEQAKKVIEGNKDAEDIYRRLKFTEDVINGRTQVIADELPAAKLQRKREEKARNNANLKSYLGRKH